MNKIYKKGDNLIIEIPLTTERYNPYMPEGPRCSDPILMNNIIGMISFDNNGNKEMGFCHAIDMSYKGKADQYTGIFYQHYDDTNKGFEELCKKIGIGIIHEAE